MQNAQLVHALSGAAQVTLYNAALADHSIDLPPATRFATKALGVAKIANLVNTYGLELVEIGELGELALVAPEKPSVEDQARTIMQSADTFDEAVARIDELHDAESASPPAPTAAFVKATKEELAAMDAEARQSYRVARRKAARAARKAVAA